MSYCHLSSEERYVISYLVLEDLSLREIGRRIGRHHSTISREIKRNRPTYADDRFPLLRKRYKQSCSSFPVVKLREHKCYRRRESNRRHPCQLWLYG